MTLLSSLDLRKGSCVSRIVVAIEGLSDSGTEHGEQSLRRYIDTRLCNIGGTLHSVMLSLGVRPQPSLCVNYRSHPGPSARPGRGHSRPYPVRPAPEQR